jgi:hypothetical protein
MKKIIALFAFMMVFALTNQIFAQSNHRRHTPKVYKVSQKEKDNQNFDLKQSKKIIAHNIKHKKANQKAAEKKRQIDTQNLTELNSSAKAKKEKKHSEQAFTFYH